jgi:hypothetical protein
MSFRPPSSGLTTVSYRPLVEARGQVPDSPSVRATGAEEETEGDEEGPSLFATDRETVSADRAGQAAAQRTGWAPSPADVETPVWKAAPAPSPDQPVINPEFDTYSPVFYVSAEYLLWWTRQDRVPPLVTTSAPADFGFIGRPTTQVLFGDGPLDRDPRSGARVTFGLWLDDCQDKAFEVSGFLLGSRSARFMANSADFPVLARPFFNLNMNTEFSQLTAFPGISTGNVAVEAPSQLWGAEANLLCKACCGCDYRVNWLAGVRYLDLNERITITENILSLPTASQFPNSRITVFDRFATHDQFYGGQVGVDAEYHRGRWGIDFRGKLALGDTHQVIDVSGGQRVVGPDGSVRTFPGGLLALPGNIGHYERDRFSVVPELGLTLSYQITDNLRAFAGYNFLYWSNVVRPGDQIDRVIDVTRIPNFPVPGAQPTGQNRPMVPFKERDFWAQGLTFGLEYRY